MPATARSQSHRPVWSPAPIPSVLATAEIGRGMRADVTVAPGTSGAVEADGNLVPLVAMRIRRS